MEIGQNTITKRKRAGLRSLLTLLIGDDHHHEFCDSLAAVSRDTQIVRASDVAAACEMLERGQIVPDMIIAATPRPGEHRADLFDRMVALSPLSRVLLLLGSWCEGEERTGCPWPGGRRIFWYDWLPEWNRELESIRSNRCPDWGLPVTTTREERLLHAPQEPVPQASGLLVVSTRYHETASALSDAAGARGYSTVWAREAVDARQIRGAVAAIWEGIDGGPHDICQVRKLREALENVPIVAILDFPRVDREVLLRRSGVVSIAAKPFRLDDLFARIEQAVY